MSLRFLKCFLTIAILVLFCRQVRALNPWATPVVFSPPVQQLATRTQSSGHIVVLKNGNVIAGLIEPQPGQYSVQTPQGSRLIIAVDDVDFVCDSMEQAYWGRLARIRASDEQALQTLFYWCLKNKRIDEAKNQIEILRATGFSEDQLGFLNARLDQQINESNQRLSGGETQNRQSNLDGRRTQNVDSQVVGEIPSGDFFSDFEAEFETLPSMSSEKVVDLPNSISQLPKPSHVFKAIRSPDDPESTEVIQVGYEEPVETSVRPNLSNTINENLDLPTVTYLTPPVHQLEAFINELPGGSFNKFRLKAERTLIQHCSNCHDRHSTIMPLMHAGRRQSVPLRMTQRNLHSVFKYLNQVDPESSPLLTAAAMAHGGSNEPALSSDSDEYKRIVDWIVSLNENYQNLDSRLDQAPGQLQANLEGLATEPIRLDPSQLTPTVTPVTESPLTPSTRFTHFSRDPNDLPPTIGEIPNLDSQPLGFVPRDEFDPEIFNRRFRGESD